MPPSPLTIATSALSRLTHERKSYTLESLAHERRLQALELRLQREGPDADDGNLEWILGQEVCFTPPPSLIHSLSDPPVVPPLGVSSKEGKLLIDG